MPGLVDTPGGLSGGSTGLTWLYGGLSTAGGLSGAGWAPLNIAGNQATLDIDFINNQAWVSPKTQTVGAVLTNTRASSAYYTNANGQLILFGNNTLRYGGAAGLLLEEARTNLVIQSQAFSNASWSKSNVNATDNAVAAPDGTKTACAIVEQNVNTNHLFIAAASITLTNATVYSFSFYAKAAGRSRLAFQADGTSGFLGAVTTIDLSTQTVVVPGAGVSNITISPLANGWFRITGTATSSGVTASPAIGLVSPSTTGFSAYQGDGVSGAFVWGLQLEQATNVSSYVATTTVGVARAADQVVSTSLLNTIFSTAHGTVSWQGALAPLQGLTSPTLSVYDTAGGANNRCEIRCLGPTPAAAQFITTSAGVSSFGSTGGVIPSAPSLFKMASVYNLNDFAGYLNQTQIGTSAAGNAPATLNTMSVGGIEGGTASGIISINRVSYWNIRLSNGALVVLTT